MIASMTDATDSTSPSQFSHFTLVADGVVVTANADFETVPGPAICTMKVWANNADLAAEMMVAIAPQLGFQPSGRVELYETEPDLPPEDQPFAYDVNFVAYDADAEDDTLH